MKMILPIGFGLLLASALIAADDTGGGKEADQGEGVSLTIYNQDFVVVRERRFLELPKGQGTVRFADVPATIVPETVQFTTLGQADAARVVNQAYEFDLVSADKLLDKYIDRDIAVVTRDGEVITGKLLNFDAEHVTLQNDGGVDVIPRAGNIKDIQLAKLPADLLTKPTLVWQVDAKKGGKQLVKVAYAALQMSWRADYRATINAKGDKMDLAGWVTVHNHTGTTFKDAEVKLMAGDLHLVRVKDRDHPLGGLPDGGDLRQLPLIKCAAFGDYHLYQLGRKTNLPDQSTKQIELLTVAGIPIVRRYAVPRNADKVLVYAEFKNSDKNAVGLGVPLPKGTVRLFQTTADGSSELISTDSVDHTPKDEPVRIAVGSAFDLKAVRKVVAERSAKGKHEYDMEVRLRNHTGAEASIEVYEAIQGQTEWTILTKTPPWTAHNFNTLKFTVTVPANGETVLTYTIRYVTK